MKDNIKNIVDKIMFVEDSTSSATSANNSEENIELSSEEKKPVRRNGRKKMTVISE